MVLTVDTNTYITEAEADTYFQGSLNLGDWSGLGSDVKERALVTATRMLERQTWLGTKASDAQTLSWPRSGVTDAYGNAVSSASVPQAIKDAQAELALALYLTPQVQNQSSTSSNTKRLKAGSAEVEYFRPSRGTRFPVIIQELLGSFLSSSTLIAPLAYGTDQVTSFDTDYGRNTGL